MQFSPGYKQALTVNRKQGIYFNWSIPDFFRETVSRKNQHSTKDSFGEQDITI